MSFFAVIVLVACFGSIAQSRGFQPLAGVSTVTSLANEGEDNIVNLEPLSNGSPASSSVVKNWSLVCKQLCG